MPVVITEKLIENVENGEGFDPNLDSDVLNAMGFTLGRDGRWHIAGMTIWQTSRHVTKSLDLVIELVQWRLPGWEWQATGKYDGRTICRASMRADDQNSKCFKGLATSPARALLGAFLRALRESELH
ncbi:hypothetical protein [Bosea sp. BIWAKO-01]|uniref:hypothetical protein n=1 Tax=Bosea sp. BIWAKO-01 TaxID=506668 RepID=UPI001AED03FC|nr:hypothetical protein [Bosea sp. BIWAKO-01]